MISYAQNCEDVVLARLFTASEGTWIDIGAGHPVHDSVTNHFSQRGWTGLNVEPLATEHRLLVEHRPRDVNVRVAISDRAGTVELHVGPPENRGSSTVEAEIASSYIAEGQSFSVEQVAAVRLDDLLAEHGITAADFLKVDVEGHERRVLESIDWDVLDVRVVVVEATAPNTTTPTHGSWEDLLVKAGYGCVLFDGLNRFYARTDDSEAAELLGAPANVLDGAEPHRWLSQVEAAREEARTAHRQRLELQSALDALVGEVEQLWAEAHDLTRRAEGLPSTSADAVARDENG